LIGTELIGIGPVKSPDADTADLGKAEGRCIDPLAEVNEDIWARPVEFEFVADCFE